MPKAKTRKSVTKRFKVTATGKVLHARPFRSHLQSTKSRKRRRQLKHRIALNLKDAKTIRNLIH